MYREALSEHAVAELMSDGAPVPTVPGLVVLEAADGLDRGVAPRVESEGAFRVMLELHDQMRGDLTRLLMLRERDHHFIHTRTRGYVKLNETIGVPWNSREYSTVIGAEDADGRIVFGPNVVQPARLPSHRPARALSDPIKPQVTLLRPGGDGKRAVESMNAIHVAMKGEPAFIQEMLKANHAPPTWCCDSAEGLCPTRESVALSALRFRECLSHEAGHVATTGERFSVHDSETSDTAKRLPAFTVPCPFLFRRATMVPAEPVPLLIYDLVLHLANNARRSDAMTLYMTKLQSEEEAAVIAKLLRTAEKLIGAHVEPAYKPGTARVIIAVEAPRAVFRIGEMAQAFGSYFAGVQLGWQAFIAGTANMFREDPGFRMPPIQDTVLARRTLRTVHDHLVREARRFGGVAISGLFPELPAADAMNDFKSPSFQTAMRRFLETSIAALARGFDGIAVSDPLYVRYGVALAEAWRLSHGKNATPAEKKLVERFVRAVLIAEADQAEVLTLVMELVAPSKPASLCPRELLAIDVGNNKYTRLPSTTDELLSVIKVKCFVALQLLTSWFMGKAMLAMLVPHPSGKPLRRSVNRATLEAFRWDTWRCVHHRGVPVADVVRVLFEAMRDIMEGTAAKEATVHVPFNASSRRWYKVAANLWLRVIIDAEPPAQLSELLTIFCNPAVRFADSPWVAASALDPIKFGNAVERPESKL